ncbi:hypothetical protein ACROYT_G030172 [Oculina patagonica]
MFSEVAAGGCNYTDNYSSYGMMLKGHIIKTMNTSTSLECFRACVDDDRCQNFNYVMVQNICEMNNLTKEARPEYFVPSRDRYYITVKDVDECILGTHNCIADVATCVNTYGAYSCACNSFYERDGKTGCKPLVPLGSIPEVPAESCAEIEADEEGKAASGTYWLKKVAGRASESFQVYCDMMSDSQAWTLIARFSNKDTKHWMNDSGYWWYDRTEATGETTDPLTNADMISPAFWLASGNEFKITRSDDSQHTPLLQTTGDCLSGQTFRSKVTSYGNFRNGNRWASGQCQGNCAVKYSGQYQVTEGFEQANCNGTMQSFDRIGFWCNWGWSNSVMMIGGGGNGCSGAGQGVGVSAAKLRSF